MQGVRAWIPQDIVNKIQQLCGGMMEADWTCPAIDFDDNVAERIVMRVSNDGAFVAFQVRQQGLVNLRTQLQWAFDYIDEALKILE